MAIQEKSVTNYTIDGVIKADLNITLRKTNHKTVQNTYSILTSKLNHTKHKKKKQLYKLNNYNGKQQLIDIQFNGKK